MFGSTSTFGAAPPAFGSTSFSTVGTTSNVFAQPTPATSTSLFGAAGFNQAKPATFATSFGSTQPSSLFGQQNRIGGTTMFNSGAPAVSPFSTATGQAQAQGTSIPFNAVTGTDTMMKNAVASPINTRHQCITCMKEYEHKSLEELRFEDYQLGRKGSQQQSTNLFGTQQPQATGGLFASMAPATGTTSTFGQRTTNFGGAATTGGGGLFSNLGQAKPNFFSTAPAATTTFGNSSFSFPNTSQPQQQNMFGANTNTVATTGIGASTFNFNQPAQQQPLFGAKPLSTPAASVAPFGQSGFGTQSTSAINKPLTLFGNSFGTTTPAPAFGSTTAPTSTPSLFSAASQAAKPFTFNSMGFGTQPAASTFGTPATQAFSFAPSGTSTLNFGGTTGTGFGTTTTTTAPSTFNPTFNPSAFSLNTSTPSTGAFGGLPSFGTSTLGASTSFLSPAPSAFGQGMNPLLSQGASTGPLPFATTPYRDSPLFYNLLTNRNLDEMTKPTNPLAHRAIKEASRRRSSSTFGLYGSNSPLKNLTFPVPRNPTSTSKQNSIFDGFEEEEHGPVVDILSPKTSVKKLSLSAIRGASRLATSNSAGYTSFGSISSPEDYKPPRRISELTRLKNRYGQARNHEESSDHVNETQSFVEVSDSSLNVTPEDENGEDQRPVEPIVGRSGVILTNPEYYIRPSIEELDLKTDVDGKCFVRGFTIGRANYGQVKFPDVINIAGVDLDKTVLFRHKEAVVYPDETPPVGQGLNNPADVEMYRVWPLDTATKEPIKSPQKIRDQDYEALLKRSCERMDAKFTSYDENTGVWCFSVSHFSKYSCIPEENEAQEPVPEVPTTGLGGIPSALLKTGGFPVQSPVPQGGGGGGDVPSPTATPGRRLNLEELLRPAKVDQGVQYSPIFDSYYKDKEMDQEVTDGSGSGEGDLLEVQMNPMTPSDGESGSDASAGSSGADLEIEVNGSARQPERKSVIRHSSVFDSVWNEHQINSSSKYGLMKTVMDMSETDLEAEDVIPGIKDSQPPIKKPHLAPLLQKTYRIGEPASKSGPATFGGLVSHLIKKVPPPDFCPYVPDLSPPRFGKVTILPKLPPPLPMLKSLANLRLNEPRARFTAQKKPSERYLLPQRTWQYRKRDEVDPNIHLHKYKSFFPYHDLLDRSRQVPNRPARVCFGPNGTFIRVLNEGGKAANMPWTGKLILKKIYSGTEIMDNRKADFYKSYMYNTLSQYQPLAQLHQGTFFNTAVGVEHLIALVESTLEQSFTELHHVPTLKGELQVWQLVKILWADSIEHGMSFAETEGLDFKKYQRWRVHQWLKFHAPTLFGKLYNKFDKSVLGLLMKGQRYEACKQAVREKNYTLALCLAQHSPRAQIGCGSQVVAWLDHGAVPFVGKDFYNTYKLQGGYPALDDVDVDRMTTSEYLQLFAAHLWYIAPAHFSVAEVGLSFYNDISEYKTVEEWEFSIPAEEVASRSMSNLCINLLKCHASHGYPVDKLLTPKSYTEDLLDYRMSWFLMLTMERLGFVAYPETFESITTSFAGQLENMGMWEYSIFVLKHLPASETRRSMIARILERNYMGRPATKEIKDKLDYLKKIGVKLDGFLASVIVRSSLRRKKGGVFTRRKKNGAGGKVTKPAKPEVVASSSVSSKKPRGSRR